MTQSALDQYALANGYGKTTSAMTEQEKVALRLALCRSSYSAASGDFIRTSGSWANQVRVMQLQLQSLKATVGQGLINIFTPVLKVINVLLGKLATLANAFKSFTELITGKKSSGQTSGSGAGLTGDASGVQDTADAYGQAADNASKLADSTEGVADATKDAAKAANGYLSPLDEINRYSTQNTSSTASKVPSSGTGSGGSPGVLLYKNWDKIKEMAGKVWDWISNKTRRFVEDIGNKLRGLATKMTTIWGNIKASAHQKWNAIWSTVSGFAERIKNAIVDKFTSAKNTVVGVFNGMGDAIRSVLNNIISVVNGAISKVNGVVSAIESAFSFGPWKVPTPFGSKTIGFRATFPRVPTVPYLAKGAVIPPRSEFLAVLGDQKQGNNIETPEALLRKIVREETAGRQAGGGSYRFTAQINRRTLFDEIMKEAQMRRDVSGRNPFEMA